MSFYSVFFIRGERISDLIHEDMIQIEINFDNNPEAFHRFLSALEEFEIEASRFVFFNDSTLHIYSTDLTLNNRIQLLDGRFPKIETSEFMSNTITEYINQTGLIADLIPNFDLVIRPMGADLNVIFDGRYYLHTTDWDIARSIANRIRTSVLYVDLIEPWWTIEGEPGLPLLMRLPFLEQLNLGGLISGHSLFSTYEIIMITMTIFLSMLFAIGQFAIKQIRESSILVYNFFFCSIRCNHSI